jgi:hypothetical protein
MEKNIFGRDPEPPKNRKEFWKIFVKTCDNISKNEKELEDNQKKLKEKHLRLEKKIDNVKKYNLIPITVAIIVAIFTGFNWYLHLQDVDLHHIEVNELLETKISHVTATEEIKWMNHYQLYMLHFENTGENEYNLHIEIKFPFNCSIKYSQPFGGKFQLINETTTWMDTHYTAFYSNINENQNFSVRLDVYNDDLVNNSSLTILPSYVRAWTNKGQVTIIRDYG